MPSPPPSPSPLAWLDRLATSASPAPRGDAALRGARDLMACLGDPQDGCRAVHVVGTAGKGTVAGLLTDRLAAAGLRVVTHMSPHVHDPRERFCLDGELPSWDVVEAAAAAVEECGARLRPAPTFFAATAAVAWVLARHVEADLVVVEAGIGGRRDATNVMTSADVVTAITAVGLDHAEVLGSDIEAVAAEKAAVLAGRSDAVMGPQPRPAAARVIAETATRHGCALHSVAATGHWIGDAVATVDAVVAVLEARLGRPIPSLQRPTLPPGRMEQWTIAGRRVVLDGAHNPMKLDALASSLPPVDVVIVALGEGKDLPGCADVLVRLGRRTLVTEFGDRRRRPRSHPAASVVAAIRSAGGNAEPVPRIATAARRALATTRPGDSVLVTGSFLHLGRVVAELEAVGGPGSAQADALPLAGGRHVVEGEHVEPFDAERREVAGERFHE